MSVIIDRAWIILYGADFSPYYLTEQTGLLFDEVLEKGVTVGVTGPHKGSFVSYGWARLNTGALTESENQLDQLVILLGELYGRVSNRLADFKIESISVWLLVKHSGEGQHGFEIRPDILRLMAQLDATLCIDYLL